MSYFLEVESHAEFHSARQLRGGGMAKERRGLHAGETAEVCVIEQIECLRVEFHAKSLCA